MYSPEGRHKMLNGNYLNPPGSVGAPGTPATGAYARGRHYRQRLGQSLFSRESQHLGRRLAVREARQYADQRGGRRNAWHAAILRRGDVASATVSIATKRFD